MIELGQRQNRGGAGGHVALVDHLLELLDAEAAQSKHPAAEAFRQEIRRYRPEISRSRDPEAVTRAGSACLEACRQYLTTDRAHHTEREAALRGLIDLLREGLAAVAADAGGFEADLLHTSDRMSALMEVGDLQTLQQRLAVEVGEIKRVVAEKQQRDEQLQTQLSKRIGSLELSLAQSRVAATLDPLTQIPNRRQLHTTLECWIEQKGRVGAGILLVLIDLDNFKPINDTYGHSAGDCVLVGAAHVLTTLVRPGDLVARYGGDEFALLLGNMTMDQAEIRLPQIVERFAQTEFPYEKDGQIYRFRCTISGGLAQYGRGDTVERLIERADEALYAAKQQGRNRAVARRASFWQHLIR